MSNVSSTTVSPPPSAPMPRIATAMPAARTATPIPSAAAQVAADSQRKTYAPIAQARTTPEDLKRATDELQQRVTMLAPELQFSVDQSSGRSIIKFTDRATNEVIQQFPSEEALHLTKAMDQFQRGLLINRKA